MKVFSILKLSSGVQALGFNYVSRYQSNRTLQSQINLPSFCHTALICKCNNLTLHYVACKKIRSLDLSAYSVKNKIQIYLWHCRRLVELKQPQVCRGELELKQPEACQGEVELWLYECSSLATLDVLIVQDNSRADLCVDDCQGLAGCNLPLELKRCTTFTLSFKKCPCLTELGLPALPCCTEFNLRLTECSALAGLSLPAALPSCTSFVLFVETCPGYESERSWPACRPCRPARSPRLPGIASPRRSLDKRGAGNQDSDDAPGEPHRPQNLKEDVLFSFINAVCLETARGCEAGLALCAGKRLLTTVCAQVCLEAGTALWADKRFLTSVYAQVSLEIARFTEAGLALCAGKRFLATVCAQVSLETASLSKAGLALWAGKRLLATACQQAADQAQSECKKWQSKCEQLIQRAREAEFQREEEGKQELVALRLEIERLKQANIDLQALTGRLSLCAQKSASTDAAGSIKWGPDFCRLVHWGRRQIVYFTLRVRELAHDRSALDFLNQIVPEPTPPDLTVPSHEQELMVENYRRGFLKYYIPSLAHRPEWQDPLGGWQADPFVP
eukprot:g21711.t1